MRQIVLDTETTGLETSQGHRVIEIGAVEMIDRRQTPNTFHRYLNPEREIDEAALEIHGITNEKLQTEPRFDAIADEFLTYLKGAELIIHNAPFDVGFINNEFAMAGYGTEVIAEHCTVLDILAMARHMHPGQKNNLDALCKRYDVDNSQRTLHGALLDAEILADVYLRMTGGQVTLLGDSDNVVRHSGRNGGAAVAAADADRLKVIAANADELAAHAKWLELLRNRSDNATAVWDRFA